MISELSAKGYWPAVAMEYFTDGKYSRVVELCMMRLRQYPDVLSGRIILARALYHSGQADMAEDEFYKVLNRDPQNMIALKYLGDIKYQVGDVPNAISYYEKVQKIDPCCRGLYCPVEQKKSEVTKILTLKKTTGEHKIERKSLRELPFETETLADLLLSQGHSRLAFEVYQKLVDKNRTPGLLEKLEKTEIKIKNGEKK